MPDPDELERLRRADPVDRTALPSPTDPEARALFEEITMTDTTTTAGAGPTGSPVPAPRRRLVALGAAAAALALVVGVAVLTRGGDDPGPAPDPPSNGPITPGGPATASCVEMYDLAALERREVAFDGTVTAVDGDAITFTVNRWFRGVSYAEVRLYGALALGGLTSAGPSAGLAPGARLLVAGDGGFAWSCGFTQPYDESVAREWERVLQQ